MYNNPIFCDTAAENLRKNPTNATILTIHHHSRWNPTNPFISNHRTLSKPLIESSINNFHATTSPGVHHRYHTRVRRSIHRRGSRQGTLDSQRERKRKRERERRGREFLDPFSIVTRLMGEGSSGFRAGNFSYARFRGKNKTGCRKRNEGTNGRRRSPVGHLPVYRRHALSARYGQGRTV